MMGDGTLLDRRQVLIAGAGAVLAAPLAGLAAPAQQRLKKGRLQPFDADWLFRRGEAEGLQVPSLDDSAWRKVDLPHDWSIENLLLGAADGGSQIVGPFDRNAIGGTATGFSVGGEGWYRKRFSLRPSPEARVEILFEGVYMDSEVWF